MIEWLIRLAIIAWVFRNPKPHRESEPGHGGGRRLAGVDLTSAAHGPLSGPQGPSTTDADPASGAG